MDTVTGFFDRLDFEIEILEEPYFVCEAKRPLAISPNLVPQPACHVYDMCFGNYYN